MGHQPNHVHKDAYTYQGYNDRGRVDDEGRRLASCILLQAMEDWISLMREERRRGGKPPKDPNRQSRYGSFYEIRSFLNSEYGEFVCGIVDLEPDTVMFKLEAWLVEFRRSGRIPMQIHKFGVQSDKTYNDKTRLKRRPCRYE